MYRTQTLVSQLEAASAAYYADGDSLISDAQFDAMVDELERLDPDHPFLSKVGASASSQSLTKIRHSIPMGSLKKITYDNGPKEYSTWRNTCSSVAGSNPKVAVQVKLDGSSISLTYIDGRFKQAVTRGDGEEGEDVTNTVRKAKGVPSRINQRGTITVRGETILRVSIWEKKLSETTKNPRNCAAGIVRRSDCENSELLNFVAFDAKNNPCDILSDNYTWKTVEEQINWLSSLGFDPVDTIVVDADSVEDAVEKILANRPDYPYEIDGAVVKINDLSHQEKLGSHHGRPYWARAWKFPASGGHSTLLGVEWNVGTRGSVDPKALIKPVDVGGVTISNVTLHNMDEIDRLGIQIGDDIEVVRAGDVIPKIIRVVKRGANRTPIVCHSCPSCGYPTKIDGPILRCTNMENCGGVNAKRIKKWIDKRNIQFLGSSSLDKLIEFGHVNSIKDLYFLTVNKMIDAGIGDVMGRKILGEIEKSLDCDLSDLLGSLSIDLLGRSQAQNIIDQGISTLSQWKSLTEYDLDKLNGFGGGSKSNRIISGLKKNANQITELASFMNVVEGVTKQQSPNSNSGSGKLSGMSFCFTGKMNHPRGKMEDMASQHGGEVHSKASKALTHLVIADVDSTSSKANSARKWGVKMISEDDFMRMIG